jgi:hypothetical protein
MSRIQTAGNEVFWKNKKIVVVLNLADDSIFEEVLSASHTQAAGALRKNAIREALRLQGFLSCPVENLISICRNQGYRAAAKSTLAQCVRWQLLSLVEAKAIRIV